MRKPMKKLISWCAAALLLSTASLSVSADSKKTDPVNKADFFTTNGAHLSLH